MTEVGEGGVGAPKAYVYDLFSRPYAPEAVWAGAVEVRIGFSPATALPTVNGLSGAVARECGARRRRSATGRPPPSEQVECNV